MLPHRQAVSIFGVGPPTQDFGEWLKEQRGSQSQRELGKDLGVSANTIGAWEGGAQEPNASNLAAIARRFGLDFNLLMTHFGVPDHDGADRLASALAVRPALMRLHRAARRLNDSRVDQLAAVAEVWLQEGKGVVNGSLEASDE